MEAEKFEISKIFPSLYTASSQRVKLVEAPSLRVLAISGEGTKDSPRYQESVAALQAVAYGLKNLASEGLEVGDFINFNLTALECLHSSNDGGNYDPGLHKDGLWELCYVVPGFVSPRLVKIAQIELSKKDSNEKIAEVHVNTLQEKKCAQIMHLGSHENIYKSYLKLMAYIKRHGYKPSSRFHEIYLNNPDPNTKGRHKTILRQPIVKMG